MGTSPRPSPTIWYHLRPNEPKFDSSRHGPLPFVSESSEKNMIHHDLFGIFSAEFGFVSVSVWIFWPKSPGDPSDDLGRSFGIIFSSKFQHPTMLVNQFHVFLFCLKVRKNMKIELFGHPLNPRALGTLPMSKSAKFCSG